MNFVGGLCCGRKLPYMRKRIMKLKTMMIECETQLNMYWKYTLYHFDT